MAWYRLYFLNSKSDRIERLAELAAADDDEAIRLAAGQHGSDPMELWCEGRKICRFESGPGPVVKARPSPASTHSRGSQR